MRSEIVFRAGNKVQNRYQLCLSTARATRRLHIPSTRTQDTINNVFASIAEGKYVEVVKPAVADIPLLEKVVRLRHREHDTEAAAA